MKLNIKGLVFVGFAAAVFASAANAANDNDYKTVTSKQYVDTEVAKKVTKNDAITGATKTKITYDAKGLVTAGADLAASDIPDISATYQVKSERVTNLNTPNDTTYPTTKAVKDAIDGVTNGSVYQAKSTTTEKQFVANGTGGWEALDTDAAPTATSTKPVQSGGVATALAGKQDAALVTTLSNADDTHYPSAKAVADAIDDVAGDIPVVNTGVLTVTQNGVSKGTFNANDATSPTIEITADVNKIETVKVNGTALTPDANKAVDVIVPTQVQPDWNATSGLGEILNKPTDIVNTINTVKVNGTPLTIDGNKAVDITVPSVGVTIPAPTTGNCGQGAPCALVIEAGTVSWEPIQQ